MIQQEVMLTAKGEKENKKTVSQERDGGKNPHWKDVEHSKQERREKMPNREMSRGSS